MAAYATYAAAPQLKGQAPGFYRMMLGDFEVTVVSDGTMDLPVDQLLMGIEPAEADELLKRQFLTSPVETSVNTFLINTGTKLLLIDTGAGTLFGPTVGKFIVSLNEAGYSPEQVDDIFITHLHGDHIGGLTANGQRMFVNAVIHVDRHDAAHWLSKNNLSKAPDETKGSFEGAINTLKPYIDAGKVEPFEAGAQQLVPGVRAIAAHGHTPGHTSYAVESKGQKLVLWGDLLHVAAVQFPKPAVTIQYDTNADAARASREKALADAAKSGYWVGIAHVAFPGIGHVRAEETGYTWVPANYSANR
jgi:glyoxylase-like metal-dependent hydrolase (beta-lactamase superfamily II)